MFSLINARINSHMRICDIVQFFRILDIRGNETLQATNCAIRGNLEVLQRITTEIRQENATFADLAQQGQRDSKMLKALSFIMVMYAPASLFAVCIYALVLSIIHG